MIPKLRAKVWRRRNGKFQAVIQDQRGIAIWKCEHDHHYGTSNRSKQDSASKCAAAQLKLVRMQEASDGEAKAA